MIATTTNQTTRIAPQTFVSQYVIETIGCTVKGEADHSPTCDRCGAGALTRSVVLSVDNHRAALCLPCTAATLYGEHMRTVKAEQVWRRARAIEGLRRSNLAHYTGRLTFWRALLTAAESEFADPNASTTDAVDALRAAYRSRIATGQIDTDHLIAVVAEHISDLEIVARKYTLTATREDIITA